MSKTPEEIKQAWITVTNVIDNADLWTDKKQQAYQAASLLKEAAMQAYARQQQGERGRSTCRPIMVIFAGLQAQKHLPVERFWIFCTPSGL